MAKIVIAKWQWKLRKNIGMKNMPGVTENSVAECDRICTGINKT